MPFLGALALGGAGIGASLLGKPDTTDPYVQQIQTMTPEQQNLLNQMLLLGTGQQGQAGETVDYSAEIAALQKKRDAVSKSGRSTFSKSQKRSKYDKQIAALQAKQKASSTMTGGTESLLTAPGAVPDFPLTAPAQPLTQQVQQAVAGTPEQPGVLPTATQGFTEGMGGLQLPPQASQAALGGYQQGMGDVGMSPEFTGEALSGYQSGMAGVGLPSGVTGAAQSGYQSGMAGLGQPQWNIADYMANVGQPLADWQMNQFNNEVIPGIAGQFGALDSARSSGMTKALGREAMNMGLGMNAQMAPQAFSAAQAGQDRSLAANQAMMSGGISGMGLGQQGAESQLAGGLSGLGLGQQGAQAAGQLGLGGLGLGQQGAQAAGQLGLGGLGYGADVAGSEQALAQAGAAGDFAKWQMGQPGMDPRLEMFLPYMFTPSSGYMGMPGTQTPSVASQIAPSLFGLAGQMGVGSSGYQPNYNIYGSNNAGVNPYWMNP